MKALISPAEAVSYNGVQIGVRVVQVEEFDFPIAPPMFWVDAPAGVTAEYAWHSVNGFVQAPISEPEPSFAVIQSVTRRQFFRALYQMDLLDAVHSAIQLAPIDVRLDFENATTFLPDDPSLLAMAQALGKTEEDIDALFALARTL